MKTLYAVLGCTLLMAVQPDAHAESTIDLAVRGTIVPVACTPLTSTSSVNLGRVSSADLDLHGHTDLGEQEHALTIRCAGPTLFALRAIDNRPGTHHGKPGVASPLGFGLTPDRQRIGSYHLTLQAEGSTIDQRAVFFTVGTSGATRWSPSSAAAAPLYSDGQLLALVDESGVTTGPSRITEAALRLRVSAYVAPASGLTLTDAVVLDGAATLELVYL